LGVFDFDGGAAPDADASGGVAVAAEIVGHVLALEELDDLLGLGGLFFFGERPVPAGGDLEADGGAGAGGGVFGEEVDPVALGGPVGDRLEVGLGTLDQLRQAADFFGPLEAVEGVFDAEQKRRMIEDVTESMVRIAGEAMRGVTWVRIQEIASGEWGIGGKAMTAADVRGAASRPAWPSPGPCRYRRAEMTGGAGHVPPVAGRAPHGLRAAPRLWHKGRMTDTAAPRIDPPSLRIRIVFGDDAMLGPGKAELLERIRETGSIAAAGRSMAMSYKRAWMLVEEMNSAFRDPLVASMRGGPRGGGARLTQAGETVLAHYRKLEEIMAEAGAARIGTLQSMLRDMPEER